MLPHQPLPGLGDMTPLTSQAIMKKVLLIDDDPITNFINKKLIETIGPPCEIIVALSGKQGIDILISESGTAKFPDIILLDIDMPTLNGFEFLRQLQKLGLMRGSSTTIAILSSSDDRKDKKIAKELGITTYLVKPISADIMRDLLKCNQRGR